MAAVDHDPLGTAMPLESLAQKPFRGSQIAPLAEPELDRVAVGVDGSVKIHPPPAHLDIRLIDMRFAADGTLAPIELFKEFW